MPKYKITFYSSNNPEHAEELPEPYIGEFDSRLWADDYAYAITDKGGYDIELLEGKEPRNEQIRP